MRHLLFPLHSRCQTIKSMTLYQDSAIRLTPRMVQSTIPESYRIEYLVILWVLLDDPDI
jgi:hypothetical protein